MTRVVLIHWNESEAQPRLELLRAAGFTVRHVAPQGSAGLREFDQAPPHAFVIDLTRRPSDGRAVAVELRRRKATRGVPIAFAGGETEKVDATRKLLPDAVYGRWEDFPAALRQAIERAPAAPVVPPDAMAGYAGRPLGKKLGIRGAVLLLGAPDGFEQQLGALPEGARVCRRAAAADRILLFARSLAGLRRAFPPAARRVRASGGLWILWPKRASGAATDLSERAVREYGLAAGWVDYKICAVDQTWSGLLFARRKAR